MQNAKCNWQLAIGNKISLICLSLFAMLLSTNSFAQTPELAEIISQNPKVLQFNSGHLETIKFNNFERISYSNKFLK